MLRSAPCVLILGLAVGLSACSRVPEIEDQLTPDLRSASYPALIPLDTALPSKAQPAEQGAELDAELKARAARLKARASALNNTNI